MAEWLRRLPAKQFPFGSVGSNPAVVVFLRKKKVKDSILMDKAEVVWPFMTKLQNLPLLNSIG